ncbi:hypothetical protein [Streptomyces sp. NPDC086787]|uniref:hypothetical protein n=1 Tax=Streptomyces sp. NPDC086787 TaxID=3365759 RepID=UPI0037FDFA40
MATNTPIAAPLHSNPAPTHSRPRSTHQAGLTGRGGTTEHAPPGSTGGGGGFSCGTV